MSVKVFDIKGRWRSKVVAFRVSPEEAAQLDTYAKLSGLAKQDYLTRRVFEKDVIVNGNPRVYKMLRDQLASVLEELQRLESVSTDHNELLELIRYIAEMLGGLKGENHAGGK
jgi:hypothetical protein